MMSPPDSAPQFLKLEDLNTPPPTAAASPPDFDSSLDHSTADTPDDHMSTTQTSPPPVIVQSRPAKKRKSWGQELPEPKTTLPPRKRAKTDDEKEQRRIERIKRNRAAAHNSRERKRQETETLAVALARANAELDAYRRLHGPLPASVVLPEVTLSTDDVDTPAPSLVESHTTNDAPSPASPVDSALQFHTHIKEEPTESFVLNLPPAAFENLDDKKRQRRSTTATLIAPIPESPLDPTQHSAAMLCDLQCRSSRGLSAPGASRMRATASRRPLISARSNGTTLPFSRTSSHLWATLFLQLVMLHFQTTYKTIAMALWTLSPSRMARCLSTAAATTIRPSSLPRSTSPLTTSSTTIHTPRLSRSTALAQRYNAATRRPASRQQGAQLAALERRNGSDVNEARQNGGDRAVEVMDVTNGCSVVRLAPAGLQGDEVTESSGACLGHDENTTASAGAELSASGVRGVSG